MTARKNDLRGFEKNMTRLEEIAQALEKNDQSLEEMLSLYEEGMKLSAKQSQILESLQAHIREITVDINGDITLKECETDE